MEGAARILLRAAVAALLNADSFGKIDPDDGYACSRDEVINLVNDALATENRDAILSLAEELDSYNNEYDPYED